MTTPKSHHVAQHVLAAVVPSTELNQIKPMLTAFAQTSSTELPCSVWKYPTCSHDKNGASSSVLLVLASNYPHCIRQSTNFAVLCGGLPYHYASAFAKEEEDDDHSPTSAQEQQQSMADTILEFCETCWQQQQQNMRNDDTITSWLPASVGDRLAQVSGHFAVCLVYKASEQPCLWVWNDAFGCMPLFVVGVNATRLTNKTSNSSLQQTQHMVAVSSYWESLVPALMTTTRGGSTGHFVQLDWDIVAEYMTFGTTLGGDDLHLYRTFLQDVYNLQPGTCLSVSKYGPTHSNDDHAQLAWHFSRYTDYYGACELIAAEWEEEEHAAVDLLPLLHANKPSRLGWPILRRLWRGKHQRETNPNDSVKSIRIPPSIQIVPGTKRVPQPNLGMPHGTSDSAMVGAWNDDWVVRKIRSAFWACIPQVLQSTVITGAALTGGGDTRLILACLLQITKSDRDKDMNSPTRNLVFQTHAKQLTDWQIARTLAQAFGLHHKRIKVSAHSGGRPKQREENLAKLHDQSPSRQAQRRQAERFKEDIMTHVLHGRFGTELLGFLCFDKTPLRVDNSQDLDNLAPRATQLFHAMFGTGVVAPGSHQDVDNSDFFQDDVIVRDPLPTLRTLFGHLEKEKESFEAAQNDSDLSDCRRLSFDIAYAFQLQLFTRAFLCDIYNGLRGGSWFAIPSSYFTRNAFSPFLDSRMLRLLLCCVPNEEKQEPYKLYGRVYQRFVPEVLLHVPSNNKLLCKHTGIPRAVKSPEKQTRPFLPEFLASAQSSNQKKSNRDSSCCNARGRATVDPKTHQSAINRLRRVFRPVFWEGAISICNIDQPLNMSCDYNVADDRRPEVRALVNLVGAKDALLLSWRLNSFLLWYERRFVPICSQGPSA